MAGKKDKLLRNAFVRKLPVPIEDKRHYRLDIFLLDLYFKLKLKKKKKSIKPLQSQSN